MGGLLSFQRAAKAGKLFKQITQEWVRSRMQEWLRKRCERAWPGGPPFFMLKRLSSLPLRHLGALPRYAVLRWATAEEDDWWLSARGSRERTSECCCGCGAAARSYPYGHTFQGVAEHHLPSATLPAILIQPSLSLLDAIPGPPWSDVCGPSTFPAPVAVVQRLPDTRCCVLCGSADNTVDHWVWWSPMREALMTVHPFHRPADSSRPTR